MKTSSLNRISGVSFTVLLSTLVLFAFTSCNKEIPFLKSSVIPAAEGYVKVKEDKNHNFAIQVHVKNMAAIDRLTPPKQSYIVWIESDAENAVSIGRLISSNHLNASLEALSQYKPNKVFITAEDSENVQQPGSLIVLTTGNF